jgi:hypothetical protein
MKISATEFSKRSGISKQSIISQARLHVIEGERLTGRWYFEEEEYHRYMRIYLSEQPVTIDRAAITADSMFTFKFTKDAAFGCLAWDQSKIAMIPNGFLPQPINTIKILVIGALWSLYFDEIVKRIQGR